MIAFDTNVLVRTLLGDDPAQTPIAERHFLDCTRGRGVLVGHVVQGELAWVMERARHSGGRAVHPPP
ncbi:MAG: hypothetical protein AMXMBFR64_07670 [Myxococcales bacterium]